MNNNRTNTTTSCPIDKPCVLQFKDHIQLVLYILVIIFGVIGNLSICQFFGLFTRAKCKSVSEVLILYLAVTDFCASVFSPFTLIYWIVTCRQTWHFGPVGCKLLPFLGRVFINMSVGIIVILALDRFRAICSPFRGQFKKKYIHISVFLTALMSILCEIYYLDALTLYVKPRSLSCEKGCLVTPTNRKTYNRVTTFILLSRDIFFVLMFTFTSIRIVLNLRRRNAFLTSSAADGNNEMVHVIRVIIVMQIVFIVLVLPRDLLHIIYQMSWWGRRGITMTKHLQYWNDFLKVCQTANCCANVFIYAKMHDRFRVRIIRIVRSSLECGTNFFGGTNSISEQDTSETMMIRRCYDENKPYTRRLLRASNCYKEEDLNNTTYSIT